MQKSWTFDEDKHLCCVNGELVPSITQVMNGTGLVKLDHIPEAILKKAAERGKIVHRYAEIMDGTDVDQKLKDMDSWVEGLSDTNEDGTPKYEWYGTLLADVLPYCDAYGMFLREHDTEWHSIEEQMMYADSDTGEAYFGIPDRIGKVDGVPTVLDIKTSSRLYGKEGIQLAAQHYLYTHTRDAKGFDKVDRVILRLKKNGKYKLVPYESLHDYEGWSAALTLFTGWLLHEWRCESASDPKGPKAAEDWSWL